MAIIIVKDSPIGWCGLRDVLIAAGILMFIKFKILSANYKIPISKKTCVWISFPGEENKGGCRWHKKGKG
jgi:hypothetical protein